MSTKTYKGFEGKASRTDPDLRRLYKSAEGWIDDAINFLRRADGNAYPKSDLDKASYALSRTAKALKDANVPIWAKVWDLADIVGKYSNSWHWIDADAQLRKTTKLLAAARGFQRQIIRI